jgi:hypothetical protein
VLWGPALAGENADLDAATNGQELQDPTGTWHTGDPAPGDLALVSNPGNPSSTTGITEAEGMLPNSIALQQNYPNPFNPETQISFSTTQAGNAILQIFNTCGQQINVLLNQYVPAGQYQFTWNGLDASGNATVSGIYLYRLSINGFTETRQMLFLK